jgi:hypothetical protein
MKGLHHLEDLRVDEEILKKQEERVWTGFTWLNGTAENFQVPKKEIVSRRYA